MLKNGYSAYPQILKISHNHLIVLILLDHAKVRRPNKLTGNPSGLAWLHGSSLAWMPCLHVGRLSGVRLAGGSFTNWQSFRLGLMNRSSLAWVPWLHAGRLSGARLAGESLPTGNPSGLAWLNGSSIYINAVTPHRQNRLNQQNKLTGNPSGLAWLHGSSLAWMPWLHVGRLSGARLAGESLPTGNHSGLAWLNGSSIYINAVTPHRQNRLNQQNKLTGNPSGVAWLIRL